MNRRIYIAGPISNGHAAKPREILRNVRTASIYSASAFVCAVNVPVICISDGIEFWY